MGTRHVEDLFSAAYDGMLDEAAQRRYDEHLESCESCARAAADFRTAVDAVRSLPPARMPVRVVLPATPPVAERRRLVLPVPRLRLPRPSPALGGVLVAAVGVAAVVLAVHGHGGPATFSNLSDINGAGTVPHLAKQLPSGCEATTQLASVTGAPATASSPPGFANRAAVAIPQRPGEELLLATTTSRYSPGSQVLVYAALTTSNPQMQIVIPCVSLQDTAVALNGAGSGADSAMTQHGPSSKSAAVASPSALLFNAEQGTALGAAAPPAAAQAAPPQAAIRAFNAPLAIAIPSQGFFAGAVPVQVLTIPAGIERGSVLRLVAVVPAGIPTAADSQPIEAVITLDIS